MGFFIGLSVGMNPILERLSILILANIMINKMVLNLNDMNQLSMNHALEQAVLILGCLTNVGWHVSTLGLYCMVKEQVNIGVDTGIFPWKL